MTSDTDSKSTDKKPWADKVSQFLKKASKFIQDVIRLMGEALHHVMHIGSYFGGTVLGLSVSPTVQIFLAIATLVFVLWLTFTQWLTIGVWFTRVLRYPIAIGAIAGLVVGIGLNLKQIAPNSWKLTSALATVFSILRIDPKYAPKDSNDPNEMQQNWHSATHRSVRQQAQVAFLIECAIVAFYVVASRSLNPYTLIVAAVSLKAPETTLLWTAHTISLFGEVSNKTVQADAPQQRTRY